MLSTFKFSRNLDTLLFLYLVCLCVIWCPNIIFSSQNKTLESLISTGGQHILCYFFVMKYMVFSFKCTTDNECAWSAVGYLWHNILLYCILKPDVRYPYSVSRHATGQVVLLY